MSTKQILAHLKTRHHKLYRAKYVIVTHKALTVGMGRKDKQTQVRSVEMKKSRHHPTQMDFFEAEWRQVENLGGEYCDRGLRMTKLGPERPLKGKKREDSITFLWGVSVTECTTVSNLFTKPWTLSGFNTFPSLRKTKTPKLPSLDAHSRRSRCLVDIQRLSPRCWKLVERATKHHTGVAHPLRGRPWGLYISSLARQMKRGEKKKKREREKLKKCLRFHVAFESFSFPLQAWFFRFIWQTLMLPESQRLHCSEDLLGKGKNIDLYRCRNTVRESESMKYTWREVDALVLLSFSFEKLSTRSQLGIWRWESKYRNAFLWDEYNRRTFAASDSRQKPAWQDRGEK